MTIWTVLIYAVAALAAVQGLLAMMTAQRKQSLRQIFEEEMTRRAAAPPPAAKSGEPGSPTPSQKVA